MLTVRNEHEPFVGRVPKTDSSPRACGRMPTMRWRSLDWEHTTLESPLAEVVWYAIENPAETDDDDDADGFFGEPGMRTIYRRTLLIAPWLNPYRFTRPMATTRRYVSDRRDGADIHGSARLGANSAATDIEPRRRRSEAIAALDRISGTI